MGTCQVGGLIIPSSGQPSTFDLALKQAAWPPFFWPDQMPQIYVNLKLITIVSIKLTLF
ncbi:hypothetical protein MES5069_310213 [Mesorhizobium escarrei]|uniref:Uncharacterized protein n=1 Tax=Mesorhizobium escarrei TaxID=666018 RepID=A0ABM9E0A5_9HYPH|nr:hypothetical protein MES5069_310213 [Mesorhizobium escarrei]